MKRKRGIRRVIIILVILFIAVYVGVQIFNQFKPGLKTETATHATVTDTVRVEGTIVRKETVVENTSSGVISFEVSDGTKVAKGGTIASVYSNSDTAAAESKRMELEGQLAQLETLNKATKKTAVNPENVSKQIYQRLYSTKNHINDFNLSDILANRDEMLNLMNQWQLATGKITTFTGRIDSLKSQISDLKAKESKSSGAITAPSAGYFVTQTDGFESVYNYEKVKQQTVEDLQKEKKPKEVSSKAIGKICEQFDWYITCIIPPDSAMKLSAGDQIHIKLPFASSASLPATVDAINQADVESDAALILRCSYMDETLANVRDETVLIDVGTYDGIRVSQEAIHFQEVTGEVKGPDGKTVTQTREVRGVYIVKGSELKFVEISPLYSAENYVICDPNPDMETLMTDSTISLYDTVALGGGELYDGKSVN